MLCPRRGVPGGSGRPRIHLPADPRTRRRGLRPRGPPGGPSRPPRDLRCRVSVSGAAAGRAGRNGDGARARAPLGDAAGAARPISGACPRDRARSSSSSRRFPRPSSRGIWRSTFRPDSKFLSAVSLRRQFADRAVSFAQGEVRVDDLHSRLTVPLLRAPRRADFGDLRDRRGARRPGAGAGRGPGASRGRSAGSRPISRPIGSRAPRSPRSRARPDTDACSRAWRRVALSEESADGWVFELSAPEAEAPGRRGRCGRR